jgi:hypothetical protein
VESNNRSRRHSSKRHEKVLSIDPAILEEVGAILLIPTAEEIMARKEMGINGLMEFLIESALETTVSIGNQT